MQLPTDLPQHFFDDALIGCQQRLVRRWLPAAVHPRPVLEPDRPWEGRIVVLYGSVLPDPAGGYRMYYTNFTPPKPALLLLATSDDGFGWHKPELGQVAWRGSRASNIVLAPPHKPDSPSVLHDPDDAAWPWKLLVFEAEGAEVWAPGWGLYGYRSADGLSWEAIPGVRLRAGDRTNLMAVKDGGRFVAYTRHVDMAAHVGVRAVYRTESADFLEWSEPRLVMAPDLDDEPNAQIYGMSVFRRNGWYLGLVEYWHDTPDVIETHLAFSRDGIHWTRPTPRTPFIRAACDWNRAWSTCASNGPILVGEQMVFHFGGRAVAHGFDSAQQYGAIGIASLPVDRFCALEAKAGGRLDTVPLDWPGGELVLNADTRQDTTSHPGHCNGSIAVEVLDAEGRPLADYSSEGKVIFRGNTHCRCRVGDGTVRWPGERTLAAMAGRTIRLRFWLDHARLFTFAAAS